MAIPKPLIYHLSVPQSHSTLNVALHLEQNENVLQKNIQKIINNSQKQ